MTKLRIIQLIVTDLESRGGSPREQAEGKVCRRIEQYWDMQGNLLFEYDPYPDGKTLNRDQMTRFSPERNGVN